MGFQLMLILGLLGMYFDAAMVFVTNSKLFFTLAVAILCHSTFFGDFLVSVGSFFGYDPCLFGRAEILVTLGLHFGRNILNITDL